MFKFVGWLFGEKLTASAKKLSKVERLRQAVTEVEKEIARLKMHRDGNCYSYYMPTVSRELKRLERKALKLRDDYDFALLMERL